VSDGMKHEDLLLLMADVDKHAKEWLDRGRGEPVDTNVSRAAVAKTAEVLLKSSRRVTLLQSEFSKTLLTGHMSMFSSFTLTVAGPFGEREAAALLKLLEAQLDVLKA
jgi:hypothetical protein